MSRILSTGGGGVPGQVLPGRYPLRQVPSSRYSPRQVPSSRYTPSARYNEIRSMSERYASYWNAFLFQDGFLLFLVIAACVTVSFCCCVSYSYCKHKDHDRNRQTNQVPVQEQHKSRTIPIQKGLTIRHHCLLSLKSVDHGCDLVFRSVGRTLVYYRLGWRQVAAIGQTDRRQTDTSATYVAPSGPSQVSRGTI